MSRSKGGDPERSLSGPSDEALVALYLGDEATSEEKDRIRAELQRRYYPHFDRMREGRPAQGALFKKRVYAVLSTSGWNREQANECCDDVFAELFMDVTRFDDLLRNFDPQLSSFQHWVINVHVHRAVIDKLREPKKKLHSHSLPVHELDDGILSTAQTPITGKEPAAEPQEEAPWGWDNLLIPRHGMIIWLFHLAYLDLNECYLEQVAKETKKTKGNVRTKVDLLHRRLRPDKRFGDSEAMEAYTLRKLLDSEHLKGLARDAQIDDATLGAIIADATKRANRKFNDRPPIDEKALRDMHLGSLGKQPMVADFKPVVRRWNKFRESELIEGKLHVLTAETGCWEWRIKEDEKYLRNLGLGDREIAELAQSAEESTLGKLKESQKAVAKGDERTRRSLAYQEHVLRLTRARRKRSQILADYNSGRHLVTPLQREMADVLGLAMGTIGGRVAEAKRALGGGVIWQEVLAVLADLDEIARYQDRLGRLRRACVVSFEGKTLVIGVPEAEAVRWWNVLLPCVEAILKKPPIHGTVKQYEQTGITIVVRNYEGDWPCGSEANGRP